MFSHDIAIIYLTGEKGTGHGSRSNSVSEIELSSTYLLEPRNRK
jgi:hypothetical protein